MISPFFCQGFLLIPVASNQNINSSLLPQHLDSLASTGFSSMWELPFWSISQDTELKLLNKFDQFSDIEGTSSLCFLFLKNLEHLFGQSWRGRVFLSIMQKFLLSEEMV